MKIIEEFNTRSDFLNYLKDASKQDSCIKGTIVKFKADWCGPCKEIKDHVDILFDELPEFIQGCNLDIDNNFDLYANMKRLKQLTGIPTIMYFNKDNTSYIPDVIAEGTDICKINKLFAVAIKNCDK